MRRLSFFLCYQRVPMDNAACADDNDATLHTVLFDFKWVLVNHLKRSEGGRRPTERSSPSIDIFCIQINALEICNQKVIWQMISFRKHDAMCRKRHFVTIMHPDHSRHSSSFTFQMGFLLFLCFLIETSSRRKKEAKERKYSRKSFADCQLLFSILCLRL